MTDYDHTKADRQKALRARKDIAYVIVQKVAIELGFMNKRGDVKGYEKFINQINIMDNDILDQISTFALVDGQSASN